MTKTKSKAWVVSVERHSGDRRLHAINKVNARVMAQSEAEAKRKACRAVKDSIPGTATAKAIRARKAG